MPTASTATVKLAENAAYYFDFNYYLNNGAFSQSGEFFFTLLVMLGVVFVVEARHCARFYHKS